MSIEKPKKPESLEPELELSVENKEQKKIKLLQDALQESYELNLSNSIRLKKSIEKIKNIESMGKGRGISLDSGAFQIAYDARLKKGDIYNASSVAELAKDKELKLIPNTESLQLGYEKKMEDGDVVIAEKIEQLVQEKGIELTVNKDALQKGYDYALENYYGSKIEEMEQFANKEGIELEVKKEVLQKAYDKILSESEYLNKIEEIEQLAQAKGIELEVNKDIAQNAYEKVFERYLESNEDGEIKVIVDLCKKRGIEVGIDNTKVQELYYKLLMKGSESSISRLQTFADEKGISLDNSNFNPQESFDKYIAEGNTYMASEVNKLLLKNGYKIKIPSQEKLQQAYDANIASGSRRGSSNIQEFGEENGIELEVKKEVLQKAYENICKGDVEHIDLYMMTELEKMAKENGIEFENAKELMEKTYIEAIHNARLGHATHEREEVMEKLQALGSDLTYEKVIKMDYLDDLKIPEEQRLNIETTVQVGDAPMTARFYGQKQETPVQGKFIIGITPDNTLEFVSDSTLGEHRDIGGKYDLEIIGGGWLEIDEQNKKVKIYKSSQDFGYEPRSISKQVVVDTFSGYEVIVEN